MDTKFKFGIIFLIIKNNVLCIKSYQKFCDNFLSIALKLDIKNLVEIHSMDRKILLRTFDRFGKEKQEQVWVDSPMYQEGTYYHLINKSKNS